MKLICPKCHLQPIEPFVKWEKMACYCGHILDRMEQLRREATEEAMRDAAHERLAPQEK